MVLLKCSMQRCDAMQLHHKWWIFVLATSVTAKHSWRLDVSMVILYRPICTLKALQMQCWGVSRVLAVVTACVGAFLFRAACILYLVWNDKRLRSKLEIEVHNLFRWSRFASPGESMFQHIVSAIHWAILGRCSNTFDDVMVVFLSNLAVGIIGLFFLRQYWPCGLLLPYYLISEAARCGVEDWVILRVNQGIPGPRTVPGETATCPCFAAFQLTNFAERVALLAPSPLAALVSF